MWYTMVYHLEFNTFIGGIFVETTQKKSALSIAGGILFLVLLLVSVLFTEGMFDYVDNEGAVLIYLPVTWLTYLLFAVLLFVRRRNALFVVPAVLLLASRFILFGGIYGGLSLRTFLDLGSVVLFIVLIVLQTRGKACALWFLPCIYPTFDLLIRLINLFRIGRSFGLGPVGFIRFAGMIDPGLVSIVGYFWTTLFFAAALWLTARWIAYPYGTDKAAASGATGAAAGDGYVSMGKCVLLLLFTFGIYYLVWIYRTTGYLNRVDDEPPRNPTTKLLLCMFVPFYSIYWMYKSAQRVDKLAQARGIPSDLSTLCLILAIFISFIPPMLMQDKINQIALAENGVQPPQPASMRAAPPVSVPEELKAYKELLDSGAITQEEYEQKKKQLLGL